MIDSTPSLCLLFRVQDRDPDELRQVMESCKHQDYDQWVIVTDHATERVKEVLREYHDVLRPHDYCNGRRITKRFDWVDLPGPFEWRNSAEGINKGLAKVTTDYVCLTNSDIIQAEGNLRKLRETFSERPDCVVMGRVDELDGTPQGCFFGGVNLGTPIMSVSMTHLKSIGMINEAYMDGLLMEDIEMVVSLWGLGMEWVLDSTIKGTHQTHPRPSFETPEGLARLHKNFSVYTRLHGPVVSLRGRKKEGSKITILVPDPESLPIYQATSAITL